MYVCLDIEMGMLIIIHYNINASVLTFWLNFSWINQLCSLMVETDGNRLSLRIFLKGNVEDAANLTQNCSVLQQSWSL